MSNSNNLRSTNGKITKAAYGENRPNGSTWGTNKLTKEKSQK